MCEPMNPAPPVTRIRMTLPVDDWRRSLALAQRSEPIPLTNAKTLVAALRSLKGFSTHVSAPASGARVPRLDNGAEQPLSRKYLVLAPSLRGCLLKLER